MCGCALVRAASRQLIQPDRPRRAFHHARVTSAYQIPLGAAFYFARPYHSCERGSNENADGLIRQYLPKGKSMAGLTQHRCNAIARKLNTKPRKRLGFRSPLERYHESSVSVALQT